MPCLAARHITVIPNLKCTRGLAEIDNCCLKQYRYHYPQGLRNSQRKTKTDR